MLLHVQLFATKYMVELALWFQSFDVRGEKEVPPSVEIASYLEDGVSISKTFLKAFWWDSVQFCLHLQDKISRFLTTWLNYFKTRRIEIQMEGKCVAKANPGRVSALEKKLKEMSKLPFPLDLDISPSVRDTEYGYVCKVSPSVIPRLWNTLLTERSFVLSLMIFWRHWNYLKLFKCAFNWYGDCFPLFLSSEAFKFYWWC